uniref:Uncharacterized protein n=1 Tax=Arundo donax TaxID=35708 RepID=A0A0A9BJU5_ARUDO
MSITPFGENAVNVVEAKLCYFKLAEIFFFLHV